MTVCIAAICDNRAIIGASDRMISSGDIQFEPERSKVRPITSSIVILSSGDSSLVRLVSDGIASIVRDRIEADPANWWAVWDVAQLWSQFYRNEISRQAEDAVLAPLGLTLPDFMNRQRTLGPELAIKLATALQSYRPPYSASVIVAGVDPSGPHIFSVRESKITCEDQAGFAAIGIGEWHSSSQLMFASHSSHNPLSTTVWQVYVAKKHAEVAPGVGVETDMFGVVGLGGYTAIGPHVMKQLAETYSERRKSEARSARASQKKVEEFIETLATRPKAVQTTPAPGEDSTAHSD